MTTPATNQDSSAGFGRGALQLAAANGAYVVLSYLMTVLLTRVLDPAEFGGFGVVMSWITVLTAILVKGLTTSIAREMAAGVVDAATAWRAGVGMGTRCALAITVVGLGAAPLAAGWFNDGEGTRYFVVGALGALTFGTNAALLAWPTGIRRYGRQALAQAMYAVARFACVLAGAWAWGVMGAVVGYVAAPLVSSIVLVMRHPAATAPLRPIRRQMLPVFVQVSIASIMVTAFFVVDVFAISQHLGGESVAVGIYLACGTLAHVPFFLLQATSIAMVPAIVATPAGPGRALAIRRTLTDTVVLLAGPTFLLVTAGDAAARVFFAQEYHLTHSLVVPLALATGAVTLLAGLLAVDMAVGRRRGAVLLALLGVVAVSAAAAAGVRSDAAEPIVAAAWWVAAASAGTLVVLAAHTYHRHRGLFEMRRSLLGLAVGALFALAPLLAGDHDLARTLVAVAAGLAWLAVTLRSGLVDIRRGGAQRMSDAAVTT